MKTFKLILDKCKCHRFYRASFRKASSNGCSQSKILRALITLVTIFFSIISPCAAYEDCDVLQGDEYRKYLGQLFIIRAPGDAGNYSKNKDIGYIINNLKIGNLFFPSYLYPENDDEENIQVARSFNKYLRDKYSRANMPPPIFFADYENSIFNSFALIRSLSPPIEALTLSSTGDERLINYSGRLSGYQLSYMGIDAVFGPNIDIDRNDAGKVDGLIGARVFGEEGRYVASVASHYIAGLKETKIIPILKHYPGFGSIVGNLHRESDSGLPSLRGGIESLNVNLEPFRLLTDQVDGVMSSHVVVPELDGDIVTISKTLANKVFRERSNHLSSGQSAEGSGNKKTILITDDLSDMDVIKHQIRIKKASIPSYGLVELSVDAIDAGHDMLLFSHVNPSKMSSKFRKSNVGINDLKMIMEALDKRASNDKIFRGKVTDSICRVLRLKRKILNNWGQIPESIQDWRSPDQDQDRDPNRYPLDDGRFGRGKDLQREILNAAFILISGRSSSPVSKGMTIFCRSSFCSEFKQIGDYNVIDMDALSNKVNERFEMSKKAIEDTINNNMSVAFIVSHQYDDISLIEHMSNLTKKNENYRKNVYIFLHVTPKLLTPGGDNLAGFNIYGNFSAHPESTLSDISFLRDELRPNSIAKVPLSLSVVGHIPNLSISENTNVRNLITFTTKKEEELFGEIERERTKVDELEATYKRAKESSRKVIIAFIISVSTMAVICLFLLINKLPGSISRALMNIIKITVERILSGKIEGDRVRGIIDEVMDVEGKKRAALSVALVIFIGVIILYYEYIAKSIVESVFP